MSNPTELPDLERIEKEALGILTNLQKGYNGCVREGVSEILEAVKSARRAQPEGEAPQAEYRPVGKFLFTGMAYEATSSDDPRGITLYRPASQHAESSAQAGEHCDHPAFLKIMDDILTPQGMAKFNADENVRLNREFASEIFRAGLTAQSQGAQAADIAHRIADRVVRHELKTHSAIATVAEVELRAALAAKAEAPAQRTELSKRIREAATADVTEAQARLLIGAAEEIELTAELDAARVSYDTVADVLTIYGIKYSGNMMREFGKFMPLNQPFVLDSRADGVLTLTKLDWGVVEAPTAQQAAAPGLEEVFDALEAYGENGDYVLASDVYDAFVKGSSNSAPGTPEAPSRDDVLEEAAGACESEFCSCCWSDDEVAAGAHMAAVIRGMKSAAGQLDGGQGEKP